MSYYCSKCLKKLDHNMQFRSMIPANSGSGFLVEPCCDTEDTTDLLVDVRDHVDLLNGDLDELIELYTLLADLNIEDIVGLVSDIKDAIDDLRIGLTTLYKEVNDDKPEES